SVGIPLKIAAAIDPIDQPFFDRWVKPEIDNTTVQFIGELIGDKRSEFLKNALALLFPIRWHEPFGLVMVESMACGTPVIATNFGSTLEVIEEGVTGYVVEGSVWDVKQPILNWKEDEVGIGNIKNALQKLLSLNEGSYRAMRRASRDRVERLFTVSSMVDGYEKVYGNTIYHT
ncbi:glycosyltransferase, partial [Patescibacteria group bacterium]|nr:glycosyltransferase [Patescibacteria group bacterium]